jgi:predicted transcriptional regulator
MSALTELLFELSNPIRLKMLRSLQTNQLRVSELSCLLEITNQECSRHLIRLVEIGLVEKDSEGHHGLTPFGSLTLENNKAHEFTSKYNEYFTKHDLSVIPLPFLHRLGELWGSTYTDDVMQTVYEIQKMVESSEEYVYRMTDRYMFNIIPVISDAIKRGVEFRLIEEVDVNYTETYDPDVLRVMIPGSVHILKESPIFLAMNEKEVAALGFRVVNGRFDYLGFKSRDPGFHEWCRELFEYYWDKTEGKDEYFARTGESRI